MWKYMKKHWVYKKIIKTTCYKCQKVSLTFQQEPLKTLTIINQNDFLYPMILFLSLSITFRITLMTVASTLNDPQSHLYVQFLIPCLQHSLSIYEYPLLTKYTAFIVLGYTFLPSSSTVANTLGGVVRKGSWL